MTSRPIDIDILLMLITRHQQYTDSARAREILGNLGHYLPKFVKIMPTEYRRALAEMVAQARQPELV